MQVKILEDHQIEKVHLKTLEILENTGVNVPHEEILSKFEGCGAIVDHKSNIVKIPSNLVMELVSKAGKSFTMYGRDLSKTAEFGVGKRNYNSSAGQAFWIDNVGDQRRHTTLSDVTEATRLGDALEQITIPGAMSDPLEIPLKWRSIQVAFEMIKNTDKPITFWFTDRQSAKYLIDLLINLRGDEKSAQRYPLFYPLFEPISPLSFPFNGIDLLFETARLNLPVHIGPMAQMGISAPATVAGTLAQENAEILAAICITQLIHEGMPVCYGGICHAFDMRDTQIIFGGPEQAIFSVAMSQIGKYYGLPVYINAGLTDSKRPDAQAGLESGITLSLGISSGADIFGHMGICGADQGSSLDILIMQSEIISYLESTNRLINFDNDIFATDLINEVGPKGSFLNKRHTAKNIRKELWFPTLLDRENYDNWLKADSMSMEERCRNRKEELLANHEPTPLDNDVKNDLEKIIEDAKRNLSKQS
jgi:trimethylamine--corrinoid protein Co-methyltransferase